MSVFHISDEGTGLKVPQISRPAGFSMERRRSRAILYQLSGHLQKQDKTKSKLNINNVRNRYFWDLLMLLQMNKTQLDFYLLFTRLNLTGYSYNPVFFWFVFERGIYV